MTLAILTVSGAVMHRFDSDVLTTVTTTPPVRTMPMEEVLKMESGDHGGLMGQFPDGPISDPSIKPRGWYWGDYDYERVDEIAAHMEKNGWDGPPVCIRGGVLHNGHHRTIAAYMAGIKDVPWTSDWDMSD